MSVSGSVQQEQKKLAHCNNKFLVINKTDSVILSISLSGEFIKLTLIILISTRTICLTEEWMGAILIAFDWITRQISDLFRLCPPPPSLVGAYYFQPPDPRAKL